MTTGGSVLKAIDVVEEMGCKGVKVILLIARIEDGQEKTQGRGYDSAAIFTRGDYWVSFAGDFYYVRDFHVIHVRRILIVRF